MPRLECTDGAFDPLLPELGQAFPGIRTSEASEGFLGLRSLPLLPVAG